MSERSLSKRLRDRAESLLVGSLTAACRALPVAPAVRMGEFLGGLVGRFDRERRNVALANLRLAYRDALSPAQREQLVARVYRHLGRFLFEELLLLTRRDLRPLSRFVEFENLDVMQAMIRDHGLGIFVSLHQGHWELLGGALSELVAPMHAVMKPVRNPLLNAQVIRLRGDLGMVLVPQAAAVPALFRHLRRGSSVALLCDLNQFEGPQFVDFFGVAAATVRTPGILAVRTGKPVVVVSSWSTGRPLSYRARCADPIVPRVGADPEAEASRIVVAMTRQIEDAVRAHPDQWNWIHPRWKTRPPGERGRRCPTATS